MIRIPEHCPEFSHIDPVHECRNTFCYCEMSMSAIVTFLQSLSLSHTTPIHTPPDVSELEVRVQMADHIKLLD